MVQLTRNKNTDSTDINLTPLVDIIFLLLIFFLITASIGKKGIEVDLPQAQTAKNIRQRNWVITIKEDNTLYINEFRISWERLSAALEKEALSDERPDAIVIKAADQTPFRHFVKVMDTCRKAGFANVMIATGQYKQEQ